MSKPSLSDMRLRDDLKSAQMAVRHWDNELGVQIRAARGLDGLGGWMSKILGRYEEDVDSAVQKVQAARVALAKAQADVVLARQALESEAVQKNAQAEQIVAQMIDVEALAAAARQGPAAAELLDLEARLQVAEARTDRLDGAVAAGSELVLELTRARTAITRAQPTPSGQAEAVLDALSLVARGYRNPVAPNTERILGAPVELVHLGDAALAFEEAMLGLGVELPATFPQTTERILELDGLHHDASDVDTRILMVQSEVEPMVRRIKANQAEAQAAVDALHAERARLLGIELL